MIILCQYINVHHYINLDMADNGSECSLRDTEIKIAAIIMYTSLSIFSFIVGLISLFLNRCHYSCSEDKQIDPMEDIFTLVLVACCVFAFTSSFQWFALYDDFVGCKVLGAIREYTMISILVILTCLGIHLLILITQPKCLQVIREEKQKRYTIVQRGYFIASFLVPIIFVPWPFIGDKYGRGGYICWLRHNTSCVTNSIDGSNIRDQLLMWYFWAVLVWLFTLGVFVTSLYRYCLQRRKATAKWKPDVNISTIISILTLFVVIVAINVLLLVWGSFKKQSSFLMALLLPASTPLMSIILFVILIIRQLIVISSRHRERITTNHMVSYGTYGIVKIRSTSATQFILPADEWDEEST